MTDPALTTCDECGGTLKKVLYPVGIQFKGSGFYVNDYAKAAPAAGANGDKEKPAGDTAAPTPASGDGKAGADKPAETKTESAPAPAAGATPAASPAK